ncbi:MAG: TetR/AcrR family transcriptional regulator [Planctomycetota bacterium]
MPRPKDPTLRHRLMRAAAHEFAERGFTGASVDGIGRRAGVTKGGVYFHFRGKEELFFAIVDEWRAGLRHAVGDVPRRGTGAAQLRAFAAAYVGSHVRFPQAARLVRVLGTELRGRFTTEVRDDLRSLFRGVRARIRELFVLGERDGSLFATDPATAAFVVAGSLEGAMQQWLAAPREAEPFCDPDSLAEAIVAPYTTRAVTPSDAELRRQQEEREAGQLPAV